MKKRVFTYLFVSSLLGASEYRYEIAPTIGYTFPNHDQLLREHTVTGMQMRFNDVKTDVKPEILFLYSDTDRRDEEVGDTDIFRLALHGVYEFQRDGTVLPFVKGGMGYEIMSDHYYDNHNSVFADAGAGIKIRFSKQIALNIEALEMVKYNKANWDVNLLYMAGLSYAFGGTESHSLSILK
jgi:OOP family OmpA-OmpF porin